MRGRRTLNKTVWLAPNATASWRKMAFQTRLSSSLMLMGYRPTVKATTAITHSAIAKAAKTRGPWFPRN